MVLDGAHPVDAAHPGLSVPLGGLLAGQVVRVHTVAWTGHGPRFSAFTQPLATHPAVNFSAAGTPYLVGVVTAATPLAPPAPPAPATPPALGSVPPSGSGLAKLTTWLPLPCSRNDMNEAFMS
jgi:hypothetical protein